MRKFVIIIFFFLIVMQLHAQNAGLNFQGVARNPNGIILASQKISLRFSVINGPDNGSIEYVESRFVGTNAQGIFSVVIGDTGALNTIGSFNNINWKKGAKLLKVEMDPSAGNNFINMGITQLQNVPYAYYANGVNALNIDGVLPITSGGTGVGSIASLKSSLNLDLVNNTSDINKPISILEQTALDKKVNINDSGTYYITPTQLKFFVLDTSSLSNRINTKASISLLDEKESSLNKSTASDLGGINSSNILFPTQKAVKDYVTANSSSGGIADGGVTTIKIANGAVTNAKLANSAVANLSGTNTGDETASTIKSKLGVTGFFSGDYTDLTNKPTLFTGAYVDLTGKPDLSLKEDAANISLNIITDGLLDSKYPSVKAVKTYVDAQLSTSNITDASLTSAKILGTIDVIHGGTGTATLASNNILVGNGTNTVQLIAPGASGNVLKSNGTNWISGNLSSSSIFSSDLKVQGLTIGLGTGNKTSNTVFGSDALSVNTIGNYNTVIGDRTLYTNTIGMSNTAVGSVSMLYNVSGNDNTAIGKGSFLNGTSGSGNTAIGMAALQSITTGSNNTAIGYLSDVGGTSNSNLTNSTSIGYQSYVSTSNTIQLGNPNIELVKTSGKVTSGTVTYPNSDGTNGQVLTTNGSGTIGWSNLSTSGTVEIGGGNYGITRLDAGGTFTADWTNSKLTYFRVGNMVFFNAIIGKFASNANQKFEIEFKPPIASSFVNSYDAMGTISASYIATAAVVSGSISANPVYNNTTGSYNFKMRFIIGNAGTTNSTPDLFISVAGSYIVR